MVDVVVSGNPSSIEVHRHVADQRIAVDVDRSRCCGVKKFKAVKHSAGGDIPIAGTLFTAAIVRIRVNEFVETDSNFLDATKSTIGVAVEKQNRGQPVPTDPGVPVVDGLNLAFRHSDPWEIMSGLAAG